MRLVAILCSLACLFAIACGSPDAVGRFGEYRAHHQFLFLDRNDSLRVFRVKLWRFADGSPPGLQLEYDSREWPVDSASSLALATRIWPTFEPYVEAVGVGTAILTETKLDTTSTLPTIVTSVHHFGVVLQKDSRGHWHFKNSPELVPPSNLSGVNGLTDWTGRRISAVEFGNMMRAAMDSIE